MRNLAKIAIKRKKNERKSRKISLPGVKCQSGRANQFSPWNVSLHALFPFSRPPISFEPFKTKFIQRETILGLSREPVYIITYHYLRIKNADSLSFSGERPILLRIYSLLRLKDREDNRASLPRKRGSWGSKAHNHFVLILLTYLGARYSRAFLRLEADVHTLLIFIHEGKAVYIFFLSLLI